MDIIVKEKRTYVLFSFTFIYGSTSEFSIIIIVMCFSKFPTFRVLSCGEGKEYV